MTTTDPHRGVLVLGKSQLVLDEVVAGLLGLGYTADATNDFSDVTTRFDVGEVDLVVFGGQVPPERKAELREEIAAINPRVIFVQGLAGIPGLIINQIQGAFATDQQQHTGAPTFASEDRMIWFSLSEVAQVKITAWWQTSFVPPDPKSDSLTLLDDALEAGDHTLSIPDHVPTSAAFATVQLDSLIYALSIATEQ